MDVNCVLAATHDTDHEHLFCSDIRQFATVTMTLHLMFMFINEFFTKFIYIPFLNCCCYPVGVHGNDVDLLDKLR